jgi:hypothetical protein
LCLTAAEFFTGSTCFLACQFGEVVVDFMILVTSKGKEFTASDELYRHQ